MGVAGTHAMILISIPFRIAVCEFGSQEDIVATIDSSPTSCVVARLMGIVEKFTDKWDRECIP